MARPNLNRAVVDLTGEGYFVLTPDQVEQIVSLLGAIAFADARELLDKMALRWKAEEILADWNWPVSNQDTKHD